MLSVLVPSNSTIWKTSASTVTTSTRGKWSHLKVKNWPLRPICSCADSINFAQGKLSMICAAAGKNLALTDDEKPGNHQVIAAFPDVHPQSSTHFRAICHCQIQSSTSPEPSTSTTPTRGFWMRMRRRTRVSLWLTPLASSWEKVDTFGCWCTWRKCKGGC